MRISRRPAIVAAPNLSSYATQVQLASDIAAAVSPLNLASYATDAELTSAIAASIVSLNLATYATDAELSSAISTAVAALNLGSYATDAELAAAIAAIPAPAPAAGGNPMHLAALGASERLMGSGYQQVLFDVVLKTDATHFEEVNGATVKLKTPGIYRVTGLLNAGPGVGFSFYHIAGGAEHSTFLGSDSYVPQTLQNSTSGGFVDGGFIVRASVADSTLTFRKTGTDGLIYGFNNTDPALVSRGRALSYRMVERLGGT